MKYVLTILCLLYFNGLFSQSIKISVNKVTNRIEVGPMTGNKNLAFGVKNITEEALTENDKVILVNDSDSEAVKLNLEIVYFDIQQTSSGISVFHKSDNETIIKIKGTLYNKDNKKIKDYIATGKSSEISTSTMIIDEGGGFNQASARSALKKTIINLTQKLL